VTKDPAFLFYPDNFIGGTALMTDEQAGIYIKALCAQFLNGHFTDEQLERVCKKDSEVKSKFIKDEKGLWYNERLEHEKKKRTSFSESQTAKINKRWDNNTGVIPGNYRGNTQVDTKAHTQTIPSISISNSISNTNSITKKTIQPDKPVDPRLKSFTDIFNSVWNFNREGKAAYTQAAFSQLKTLLVRQPEITGAQFEAATKACVSDSFHSKNFSLIYVSTHFETLLNLKKAADNAKAIGNPSRFVGEFERNAEAKYAGM
jgi:hypothetical protein